MSSLGVAVARGRVDLSALVTTAIHDGHNELQAAAEELVAKVPELAREVTDLTSRAALYYQAGLTGQRDRRDAQAAADDILGASALVLAKGRELGAQSVADRYHRALSVLVAFGSGATQVLINTATQVSAGALMGAIERAGR